MADIVFQSVRKISHSDWLPNGRIFYDIGSVIGPGSFGGKILELIFTKFKEN